MHGVSVTAAWRRQLALVVLASALCVGPLTAQTHAGPPATADAVGSIGDRWIEHRVAPGERIREIADLYSVSSEQLITWNKLDKDQPMIRTGQMLRIQTIAPSQSRVRASYTVRRGDSWSTLAKRFEVTIDRIRDVWNKGEAELQLGARIVVFRLPEPELEPDPLLAAAASATTITPTTAPASPLAAVATKPAVTVAPKPAVTVAPKPAVTVAPKPAVTVAPKPAVTVAPIVPAMTGAQSLGAPDRGRIANAAQIPINEGLYTLRKPEHSYGSSFAISQLTLAIQRYRAGGFSRELVIQDMSRQKGGRFRPHESHQSGRDIDIRLPLREGVPDGTLPDSASQVDWDAAWALVNAMISTGHVRFIFLTRQRQKPLYEAALRAGATEEELAVLMQFPRSGRTAIVRHARGHVKHIHVRFNCGPDETSCIER